MNRIISGILAAFLLVGFAACQGETVVPEVTPQEITSHEITKVKMPEAVTFDDYETRNQIWEQYPVAEETAQALMQFSSRSAAELLSGQTNSCYSPLSLYYALALSTAGAAGETQQQFLQLLGFDDTTQLSQQCGNLLQQLFFQNEFGSLMLANSLWLENKTAFRQEFIQNAEGNFYSSLFQVDFADPNTGTEMSQWVERQTNGLLKPQITPDAATLLSILGTVYLKDEWTSAFSKENTKQESFYCEVGSTVKTDFMHRTDSGSFLRGENYLRASLSTKNNIQMVFILPDEGTTPSELLANEDSVQKILSDDNTTYGEILWSIPKFSINSRYELAEPLKKLGLTNAFSSTNADFSGMAEQPLFLSEAIQEARISVDENGLEAGAYTELGYAGAGMPQDTAEMNLNRPFLYAVIKDGIVLFIGCCGNPAQ